MSTNHVEIIKKLPLWKHEISVQALSGGITNFTYLVLDGRKKYVARFAPKSNVLLGLNRKQEVYNTRIAFSLGLGPKIVKFFSKHGLLVIEYVEGKIFTPDQGRQKVNIERLASLFRKLHRGPKFSGFFDPFEVIDQYIARTRSRKSWLPSDINRSLKRLHDLKSLITPFQLKYPCHLDLVIENIVHTGRGIKLIDWEYSANSDPRFDLAMFSVKSNFSARHDALLLKAYGLKTSRSEFEAMKAIVHFREAAWGFLQLAVSKIKFDYKKYATDNLASFNTIVRNL